MRYIFIIKKKKHLFFTYLIKVSHFVKHDIQSNNVFTRYIHKIILDSFKDIILFTLIFTFKT